MSRRGIGEVARFELGEHVLVPRTGSAAVLAIAEPCAQRRRTAAADAVSDAYRNSTYATYNEESTESALYRAPPNVEYSTHRRTATAPSSSGYNAHSSITQPSDTAAAPQDQKPWLSLGVETPEAAFQRPSGAEHIPGVATPFTYPLPEPR
jgi:hypothetical protein